MTEPDDITEDRGFKALFTAYPVETVEVFVPELFAQHGRPVGVEAVQQEAPLPDLGYPSRFLDVALLCTWTDGSRSVVLLVEHWSEARRVDLDRVLYYAAALRLQHRADVFPVILVTDPAATAVPDRIHTVIADQPVLDFRVRVVRIGPEDLPRLRSLQNRVAVVLQALALRQFASERPRNAVLIVAGMTRAPGPVEDIHRFLPFVFKVLRMPESDEPRFRQLLREEPDMGNAIEEIYNEATAKGMAKGKAEGKAEGRIAEIRHLVNRGYLTVDSARAAIRELIANNEIPEAIGQEALTQLG